MALGFGAEGWGYGLGVPDSTKPGFVATSGEKP